MKFIKKINQHFFKVSAFRRKLVIKAYVYMLIVRYWMLHTKFSKYEKYLGKRQMETTLQFPEEKIDVIQHVRAAVNGVSKNTPWESKCMVQAITGKWLLKQQNIESTLYFGVLKNNTNDTPEMKAHAWLKVGDRVIIGRKGHRQFTVVNFYT